MQKHEVGHLAQLAQVKFDSACARRSVAYQQRDSLWHPLFYPVGNLPGGRLQIKLIQPLICMIVSHHLELAVCFTESVHLHTDRFFIYGWACAHLLGEPYLLGFFLVDLAA